MCSCTKCQVAQGNNFCSFLCWLIYIRPRKNPYKPNNNALVFFKDPLCSFIDPPTNYPCKAPNDQCDYEVHYADYGSSLGVLIRDTFPLRFTNGSVYRPTLAFGCRYDQEFSGPFPPPYVDGVLGLGNSKSSIVSQLHGFGLTRNVIGHCFGGQGRGFLFFGDDLLPPGLVRAPILRNSLNHYMFGLWTRGPPLWWEAFSCQGS
ncbi:eukaryotic aspartyl protease family protein [Actinidia rufa]|uniref:Eukaryotic aspartyl protease family protein n=1 Tax=Actinidia rufa TaxID=165716 RepID=A0A7J0GGE2_9ERIC|nr:eukaryotic aspartyl protease family protein [Actinidia rufa]